MDDVSVEFEKGSIHALMGENGTGKRTLGKIIAGVYLPDKGVIKIEGQEVKPTDPRIAKQLGIALVHQELAFCPNTTVAENLLLGGFPTNGGFMDWAKLKEKARALLGEIGADICDFDTTLFQTMLERTSPIINPSCISARERVSYRRVARCETRGSRRPLICPCAKPFLTTDIVDITDASVRVRKLFPSAHHDRACTECGTTRHHFGKVILCASFGYYNAVERSGKI